MIRQASMPPARRQVQRVNRSLKMKTRQRPLFFGSLIALLLVGGCGSSGGQSTSTTATQTTPTPQEVDVVPVTTQKLELTQSFPGELIPYESVDIHAKTTGFGKSISVDRGSRVRRGDLLAEIEAPELAAQRSEAESKLSAAQSQLAAAQAKVSSDEVTYERLASAAKTPGVVAGNDVDMAAKAAE